MLLPGTEIHLFVFILVIIETGMFLFQLLYCLARPADLSRRWFLLLLLFMIYYNCVSGFLPDPNIPISIGVQNIIAYSGGLFVSMYLPFYIYKVFGLSKLRKYAYSGSVFFLILPFILCFVIPYYMTGNLDLSRRMVVLVPFVYALSFIYYLGSSIYYEYARLQGTFSEESIAGVIIAVVLWAILPIIVYFDGEQLIENTVVNAGLLFLSISFIKKSIVLAREEYKILLASQKEEILYENPASNDMPTKILSIDPWAKFQDLCLQYNITSRELEIIHYIRKRYNYKDIGDALFISEKTVSRHIANIYFKTGVNRKIALLKKLEYPVDVQVKLTPSHTT